MDPPYQTSIWVLVQQEMVCETQLGRLVEGRDFHLSLGRDGSQQPREPPPLERLVHERVGVHANHAHSGTLMHAQLFVRRKAQQRSLKPQQPHDDSRN